MRVSSSGAAASPFEVLESHDRYPSKYVLTPLKSRPLRHLGRGRELRHLACPAPPARPDRSPRLSTNRLPMPGMIAFLGHPYTQRRQMTHRSPKWGLPSPMAMFAPGAVPGAPAAAKCNHDWRPAFSQKFCCPAFRRHKATWPALSRKRGFVRRRSPARMLRTNASALTGAARKSIADSASSYARRKFAGITNIASWVPRGTPSAPVARSLRPGRLCWA